MITPLLEKAILSGKAKFQIHNHAQSNWGRILIPRNSTVIITHIKWYPFYNFKWYEFGPALTWREFFKFNEYQLKVDGKKSINYFVYRNSYDFKWMMFNNPEFPGIDLNSTFNQEIANQYMLPLQAHPIHTDVFLICEEYVKLTLTNNVFNSSFAFQAPLNPSAAQQPPPSGLEGVAIQLRNDMSSPTGQLQKYVNGSNEDAYIVTPTNRTHTANYIQDIDANFSTFVPMNDLASPYQQSPLVEFGYVTINTNDFNNLQNS